MLLCLLTLVSLLFLSQGSQGQQSPTVPESFGSEQRRCGRFSPKAELGEVCRTTRPMTRRSGRSCFTGEKAMSSVQSRSPKFSVTGRRLDAPTPPLLVDQTTTNAIYADRHEFPNAWLLGDHGPLQG
jgi:hypothetical protein